jgi:hypothetical protein
LVIGGDQHSAFAVVEDGVGGGVSRPVVDVQGPVAQLECLRVAQRPCHVGARTPGAKRTRHGLQRRHHVLPNPVAQHGLAREVVVRVGLEGVVLDDRHRHVDRRYIGARTRRHERHQAEVVDVLVGEDHEPDVLERVAESLDSALEFVEGGAGVGPRVHQRKRLVLDEVDVHPPHRERRGDCQPVYAGRRRGGKRVVAGRSGTLHWSGGPYRRLEVAS